MCKGIVKAEQACMKILFLQVNLKPHHHYKIHRNDR